MSGGALKDAVEALLGGACLWLLAAWFCVCRHWAFGTSESWPCVYFERATADGDLVAGAEVAGGSGSIFQVGREAFAQFVARAEEEAFYCGKGHFEDVAELLIREFLVTTEYDSEALLFRECGDGLFKRLFEFFLLCFNVGAGCRVVGELSGLIILGFGFEGDFFAATAATGFVENEIAGNGVEPGRELGGGFIARRTFPDADEDLLSDVVSIIDVPEHSCHGADDGALVEFDELLEGPNVALFDLEHELGADIFRRHQVRLCLRRQGGVNGLGMPDRFRHEQTGGERRESSGTHWGCKPSLSERVAGKVFGAPFWRSERAYKEDFRGIQKEPEGSSIWTRRGWMVRILKASGALVKRKVLPGWPS